MRSYGNIFCGDVVLDSVNIAYSDEDSSLYQINSICFGTFIMKLEHFINDWRNYIFKEDTTPQQGTHEIVF